MTDDPLERVYSLVERSYVRLQAGDLLIRCLEEASMAPIQEMVEGLILAGPQSLDALREIMVEVGQRKSQVRDDILQVYADLKRVLNSYGVRLDGLKNALGMVSLAPLKFLTILQEQGVDDNEIQTVCLQLFHDSRELIINLSAHLRLLEDVETYLQDWLWGVAYQSAHQGKDNAASIQRAL